MTHLIDAHKVLQLPLMSKAFSDLHCSKKAHFLEPMLSFDERKVSQNLSGCKNSVTSIVHL
jgi:hypothetical protein